MPTRVFSADDASRPASSSALLQGVLRDELGFEGVVVTDALDVAGVRTEYGDDRVPVLAPKAGVDQLLFPPDIDVAYHGVLAAVRSGDITEDRLDESVVRILRIPCTLCIKDKVGLLSGPLHLPEGGNALPLRRGQRKPLGTGASPAFPTDDTRTSVPEPAQAFEALGYRTTHLATGREADAVKIDEAVAAARGRGAVVVTTDNVGAVGSRRLLVSRLRATGDRGPLPHRARPVVRRPACAGANEPGAPLGAGCPSGARWRRSPGGGAQPAAPSRSRL